MLENKVELSHQLGFENQENIQLQMSNFSKNFDVLLIKNAAHKVATNEGGNDDANPLELNVLMCISPEKKIDINDCEDLLKDIVTAAIEKKQFDTMINMNIPMLKSGYILTIVEKSNSQKSVNRDCYLDVENVDNNIKAIRETLMAIFKVVDNDIDSGDENCSLKMKKMGKYNDDDDDDNTNSNNKKLTNNCKIYINNDNINFSYNCDDEYYEIIFNDDASVFLSVKPIDIDNIGCITKLMIITLNGGDDNDGMMMKMKTMNMMYQLQSHLIKSFIVNEMVKINDKTSTTSQSNTNKSEYAFERTLNNFKQAEDDDNDNDANVANNNYNIDKRRFKSMIMNMDSIPKLFSFIQRWCSFKCMMMRNIDDDIDAGRKIDDDNDDAGYMMIISEQMMQLQSFNESDQQSGIVSNNSSNDNSITTKLIISDKNNFDKDGESEEDFEILMSNKIGDTDVDQSKMMKKPMNSDVDIGGSEYSHKDDQIGKSLIVVDADDTVNITCDFNYLNYKIKSKINDQNRMDETRIKEDNGKLKVNNTTSTNNTSSLADKKTTINIDELIECQHKEKSMQIDSSSRRMRLAGGGENSLSGASGWGSPPTAAPPPTNNNPVAAQWGAPAQQAPQQPWNQPPGGAASSQAQGQQGNPNVPPGQQQNAPQNPNQKPLTPGNPGGGWNAPPQVQPPPQQQQQIPPQQAVQQPGNGGAPATGAAKIQLEQLNSMREALFAQDGWGCQNVNQDSNWDVPGSPEPSPRNPSGGEAQPGAWKPQHLNNGTELWESNLRNGGQPAPQPIQKTPWQGPSNPIGGTWGEDDDNQGENVWPGNQTQQAAGWNQPPSNPNANSNASSMWPNSQGEQNILNFTKTFNSNFLILILHFQAVLVSMQIFQRKKTIGEMLLVLILDGAIRLRAQT